MSDSIEVKVKHLSHDTFSIKISPSAHIIDLKNELEKLSSIKANLIKLIYKGKILKVDTDLLSDHKIEDQSTLHMVEIKLETTPNTP